MVVAVIHRFWARSKLSDRTKALVSALLHAVVYLAALASLLLIVVARVPFELRDGWYGLGVGIISASCIVGVITAIIGLLVNPNFQGDSKKDLKL